MMAMTTTMSMVFTCNTIKEENDLEELFFTSPVDERLDQLAAIQLTIQVHIMHAEIVKHQLLLGHGRDIHGNVHVLLHVPEEKGLN